MFMKENPEKKDKIINSLKTNYATGPDGIPAKFIEQSENVIDSHLTYIINKDIAQNDYSEKPKTASVRPIFKKDEGTNTKISTC